MPGLVHVGADKIFVGRSFVPFGVSQERVCEDLNAEETSCGVCPRTLRNHLKRQGIERRQLVQSKPEYRKIAQAIAFGAAGETIHLEEFNGKTSAKRPEGHLLKPERFFRYLGADWLYRCNLYALAHELSSCKRSRHNYKKLSAIAIAAMPVENSASVQTPQTPQIQEMPTVRPAGAAGADGIKEEKNDNPYVEQVSANNEVDWREKCMAQVREFKMKKLQERWLKLTNS